MLHMISIFYKHSKNPKNFFSTLIIKRNVTSATNQHIIMI